MTIGFIGFGEAASNIAEGLLAEGAGRVVAYDVVAKDAEKGKRIRVCADRLGVGLCETEAGVAEVSDVIFAAVPSTFTVEECKRISPFLRPGQIYADVSASTPKAKREIWDVLKDTGVLFADAAMLGALGVLKHKVPVLACGNGAMPLRDRMTPFGMKITCMEGEPGAASAIKLMRSIYTKGIAAVMLEMLKAAEIYGVEEEVLSSLSRSLDGVPFASLVNRYCEGAVIHAKRRAGELKGSLQMLAEAGVESGMTDAAISVYEAIAESGRFEGASLETKLTLKEILRRLNERE